MARNAFRGLPDVIDSPGIPVHLAGDSRRARARGTLIENRCNNNSGTSASALYIYTRAAMHGIASPHSLKLAASAIHYRQPV